jgi:hypothetical protein
MFPGLLHERFYFRLGRLILQKGHKLSAFGFSRRFVKIPLKEIGQSG